MSPNTINDSIVCMFMIENMLSAGPSAWVPAHSAQRDFQWLVQRTLRSGLTFAKQIMATHGTITAFDDFMTAKHIPSGGSARAA